MNVKEIYRVLYSDMGDLGWWPAESPDEVVIGTVLTQNTSWKNVEKSLEKLRESGMMSLRRISEADVENLSLLIKSSGFYNQKSMRLKDLASRIVERYGSVGMMSMDRTDSLAEFLKNIKGVGQETMDSILLYALEKPVFVIDKYTERVFSRVGVLDSGMTAGDFRDITPVDLDHDVGKLKNFHGMIVQLAKEHCKKEPLCEGCPLSGNCRYYTEVMLP
ncbi:hypothetical protein IX51_00765 [uncultured archaeon]|nr:hypothetical protein IX51_00765 [uncultured archaeon]HKJ97092.1 endonuclease III domain-containing protein [Thermoplasmataceae archaeon]